MVKSVLVNPVGMSNTFSCVVGYHNVHINHAESPAVTAVIVSDNVTYTYCKGDEQYTHRIYIHKPGHIDYYKVVTTLNRYLSNTKQPGSFKSSYYYYAVYEMPSGQSEFNQVEVMLKVCMEAVKEIGWGS